MSLLASLLDSDCLPVARPVLNTMASSLFEVTFKKDIPFVLRTQLGDPQFYQNYDHFQ